MQLFKKKDERLPSVGKGFLPIERVKDLSSKGFAEAEIIDVLRKEGYSPEEIDKGLTQALRSNVSSAPTPASAPLQFSQGAPILPTLEQIQPASPAQIMPQIPETSLPQQYYYEESYSPEEYVDYLVKEKTTEMEQKMSVFAIRYEELEKKTEELHEMLTEMTQMRGGEQQQILNKIDSFKDVLNDVDTRMSSLEKAFKETLPALIESVRALSDVVQRLKKEG